MKTRKQCALWFVAAVMFCAVVSAGCGGSSSNDDNTPAAQDEESGGRNTIGDDWEDLGFELFSGMWQIDSTEMILGNGVQLETQPPRLPFIMNTTSAGYLLFTDLFGQKADNITATFSGNNTDGQTITARGMPL